MKRFIFTILLLLSFGCSFAEIETDPIKREELIKELANFADSLTINNDLEYQQNMQNKCLSTFQKLYSKDTPEYVELLDQLTFLNVHIGNYYEAIRLATEAMCIKYSHLDKNGLDYSTRLNYLALWNSHIGNYKDAIELSLEAINIIKNICGENNDHYLKTLMQLSIYHSNEGNYAGAIKWTSKLISIYKEYNKDTENYDYSLILRIHAINNSKIGNYYEAIKFSTEALIILKKYYGENTSDCATLLGQLAEYNTEINNYAEAIQCCKQKINIIKKNIGNNHPEYIKELKYLAWINTEINNYAEAILLEKEALSIIENIFGKQHKDYETTLITLAIYNCEVGNYLESIRLLTEINKHNIPNYALLQYIVDHNSKLGNFSIASKVSAEVLRITGNTLGVEHPLYLISLQNLAKYNCKLGNYSEARQIELERLDIVRKTSGRKHPDYAYALIDLASINSKLGNYTEAIKIATDALNIIKNTFGEEHSDFTYILSMLAVLNCRIGNKDEAIRLGTKASDLIEDICIQDSPVYVDAILLLSLYNYEISNFTEAIQYGTDALCIIEKKQGKENRSYARALQNQSLLYIGIENYHEAIKYETEALSIIEKDCWKDHPDYIDILFQIASIYYKLENVEYINLFTKEWVTFNNKLLLKTFLNLTNAQRQYYWNEFAYRYQGALPLYTYSFPSDTLAQCAYDGTLISKGILLNTETELAALIAESGDKVADELYQQLLLNRGQLNKLYEMPISERWADTDSMELATEKIEHELIERSKVYGDFTHNLTIDWKQVQAQLKEDDIAIEFLSFPIENDSVMYCALTLKHDYEAPRMVPLFETRDLAKIAETDYFTTSKLTQLVWQPLAEELQSVRNIYFAPAGELHRIAIEYLPFGNEGRYVFDYWSLYRLSSTRELAKTKSEKNSTNIALYGGLRYEAEGVKFEKDVTWGTNYLAMTRALPDSIGLRAQYGYLHGTLNEVTEINALYEKNSIPTILYTGSIGTESTIKALSGKRISNLHISTHGFYYSEKEVESKQDLRHLSFLQHDDTPRYIEDKSMTRSGLLFAGANATLKGDSIPEGCDDGILTAQEIASLDFRGLDLLVLSACQTGLGEIKGDGVFGLQRGFKKAGAQTIVMSLWKVDDFATNLLMTQFYNNLLAGHSKREAFHKAQEVVRSNYPDDPHKWAGFIMLDGID